MHLINLRSSVHTGSFTAAMLLALATLLSAAPPTPLTPTQLEELNGLATPMSKQINRHRQEAQKNNAELSKNTAATDATMRHFLMRIGQGTLLAQNNTASSGSSVTPATTAASPSSPTASPSNPKAAGVRKSDTNSIKIECDGGFYFDGEEGVLAYLKNIRLTDSGSRFKIKCSDELKIFLVKESKDLQKSTDAANPEKPPEDGAPEDNPKKVTNKKDRSFAEFGKLKQIIASGNVVVTGKDNKGLPFMASGNIASYNAITGEIILKDGLLTLQQSANQYVQAREPGQWIRIQMKDKRIQNIGTSDGHWEMQAFTEQKKP